MKVKVSELSGAALDWAVAVAEGESPIYTRHWVTPSHPEDPHRVCVLAFQGYRQPYEPSQWWGIGGPIIERGLNNLFKHNQLDKSKPPVWCAVINVPSEHGTMLLQYDGPTPLIAAMRCYVASKLGEEVDIPEELV